MKITKRASTPEQQLTGFIEKFDPKNATLIRSVRKVLRARLPTTNELVYDNYNFFVIGYCSTERPSIASCPLPLPQMASGYRSTAEPRSLILTSCSSAAAPKTVLSG